MVATPRQEASTRTRYDRPSLSRRRRFGLICAGLLATLAGARPAGAADALLSGAKLVLAKRGLTVLSTDASVGLGAGPGSVDDPVLHGATLRVLSIEGDVFDETYPLPAAGWRYLKKKRLTVGVAFHAGGAIRSVVVKTGKVLQVRGHGKVGHTLGGNPAPVRVVLTLGQHQSCMSFGGTTSLKGKGSYLATGAPAPDICPLPYGADDRIWVCRPDLPNNPCLTSDLDAHEINPDLSSATEAFVDTPGERPYDCFYVYPTVDLSGPPGNHLDVTDSAYGSLVLDALVSQAARFRNHCRLFAPHYRQITINTYFQGGPNTATYKALAFRDVLDAWRLYLKFHNGGRNVVIMGHSQGTDMTTRLMQQEVDPVPALRSKLIVALLIGFDVAVPPGEVIGGTFQNIPLCTTAAQTGCVIAYRSYAEGFPPTAGSNDLVAPGLDVACTNPAALGGGEAPFAKTYLPAHTNQPLFDLLPNLVLDTPFALYQNLYAGECVKDSTNHSYLEVRVRPGVGDLRQNLIPFTHPVLAPGLLGTHILDYQWDLGDLLALVATKAAAMP